MVNWNVLGKSINETLKAVVIGITAAAIIVLAGQDISKIRFIVILLILIFVLALPLIYLLNLVDKSK